MCSLPRHLVSVAVTAENLPHGDRTLDMEAGFVPLWPSQDVRP